MALLDLDAMHEDLVTWSLDLIHLKVPTMLFFGYSFLEVTQLCGPERSLLQLAERKSNPSYATWRAESIISNGWSMFRPSLSTSCLVVVGVSCYELALSMHSLVKILWILPDWLRLYIPWRMKIEKIALIFHQLALVSSPERRRVNEVKLENEWEAKEYSKMRHERRENIPVEEGEGVVNRTDSSCCTILPPEGTPAEVRGAGLASASWITNETKCPVMNETTD